MFTANKILIADDHPLFRDALQSAVLQGFGEIEIISADSFLSLQRAVREHDDCDLILLDLMMPGSVGFSALHYLGLECPQIPVMVVSGNETSDVVARALDFGALAFVPKSAPFDTIVEAMHSALAGDVWTPPGWGRAAQGQNDDRRDFAARVATLTPKQFRVLMLLADGHQNKQIAADLFVSEATIKAHLTTIFQKLGVQNRTQAAAQATRFLKVDRQEFARR